METVLGSPAFGVERGDRFRKCGTQAVILIDAENPTRVKVGCKRCHDRFCLPCAQDRARLICANLADQMPDGDVRFVTLTMKHSADPLREQLKRLYECFAALRRRHFWSTRVVGGAAFCEVKLGKRPGEWHPHLHIICQGRYIPQKQLAQAWHEITGDSFVVDVRMAGSMDGVARYVVRYVTKGWSPGLLRNPDLLADLMIAFRGRKLVVTFGTWRALKLLTPPADGTWDAWGTLVECMEAARRGDVEACELLRLLDLPGYEPPLEPVPPGWDDSS